ncbi:hypothetical protein SAMN05444162_0997 [Paenibacillaceae bacterium GAS479]|nr:hypothetical protein SAMN05444162_0997 [Paenibacillaceae bacterium GAS479]
MRMKIGIGFGIVLLAVIVFIIPFSFEPPGDTRMVADRTNKTYIAPPCFDEANPTNNLAEVDWTWVKQSGYKPESSCTSEKLMTAKVTLGEKFTQLLGLSKGRWAW